MLTLEDATALVTETHADQTDKAGAPCVLHLLRVMQFQTTEEAMMAGVLHDLVEDTDLSFNDLWERGYPGEVIAALDHVAKRDGEFYQEFAERAGQHPIDRWVKVADLEDNMNVARLETVTEKNAERLVRYQRAYRQLTDEDPQ
ncbi:(p)ppGpp synthase/HD superfamily hydrolase [Salinibacter ruber]|uniref:hypothetical protein n=1 Tax=Salinibacter ruber TaxID=146919 RepID=UPI00216811EB|nr:hypothetical protein [Salinibacter ruber]MCS3632672.1 (p)ppGpp synthase/HD superfamily hydrolase [Salinibacter ruber]